jgi:hypothetical protein
MVLRTPDGYLEVAEWGGSREDVACLWASLLSKTQTDTLNVPVFSDSELFDWALENASEQTLANRSCMVRIFEPFRVLKAFEPQLQRRYQALGIKARQRLEFTCGKKSVSLEVRKGIKISRGKSKGVALSSAEMTGLMFGLQKPSREIAALRGSGSLLDLLFPLEWHWWRSDWI